MDELDLELDRLRDAALGRLPAGERERLDARRATDPELDAVARDVADVFASAEEPCPPCTLAFETVAAAAGLDRRRGHVLRLALAVAVAASLVVGVVRLRRADSPREVAPGPVVLASLVLGDAAAPEPLPASATTYAPVGADGLAFVAGLEEGRALAAAAGRPLIVFVHVAECPICRELFRSSFRDAALAKAAEGFVLAEADLARDGDDVLAGVTAGWPPFLVYAADGRRVGVFEGATVEGPAPDPANPHPSTPASLRTRTGPELADEFARAAALAGGGATPVAWNSLQAVARRLSDAAAAKDTATRLKMLDAAAAAARGTPLAARVRAEAVVATRGARTAIESARALADAGRVDAGAETLKAAAHDYRGTPIEDDLLRVRERLLRDRRFPTLEETRTP